MVFQALILSLFLLTLPSNFLLLKALILLTLPLIENSLVDWFISQIEDLISHLQFNILASSFLNLLHPHYDAAIRLLRYIKSSPSRGVFFSVIGAFKLLAYANSDWARCPGTRKLVTGFMFCLVLLWYVWKSKKEHTISRFSTEVEYGSLASLTRGLQQLRNSFKDL